MTPSSKHKRYSVFRHRLRADLCCAIVEGDDEPGFLDERTWRLAETLDRHAERPAGFDDSAAVFSCAMQGFYVFFWGRERWGRSSGQDLRRADARTPPLERSNLPGAL